MKSTSKIRYLEQNDLQPGRYEIDYGTPIFFDMDGVLIDSTGLHNEAFAYAYNKVVKPKQPLPVGPQKHVRDDGTVAHTLPKYDWDEAAKTSFKLDVMSVFDPKERSDVKKHKDKYFKSQLHRIVHSFDLTSVLKKASNPLALVTSCSRDVAMLILQRAGLIEVPWKALVMPMGPDEKKQQTYERALKITRWHPHQVIAYEDSQTGVEAAQNAHLLDVRRTTFKELSEAAQRVKKFHVTHF